MGSSRINVNKTISKTPVLNLIAGDMNTTMATLVVERFVDGVDLSGLGFSIYIKNAADSEDIIVLGNDCKVVEDSRILLNWTIGPVATEAAGDDVFAVVAVDSANERVWQSSERFIHVIDKFDVTPDYEPEDMSEFNQAISAATVEINDMRESIAGFTDRFNEVVEESEAIIESCNNAIASANDAADTANASAANATEAAAAANVAYEYARDAADDASEAVADINRRLADGEFIGPQGPEGPMGPQGYPGQSVVHIWNGYVLQLTSSSGTTYTNLRGQQGPTGPQGPTGLTGPRGQTGAAGFSPTVEIIDNDDSHVVNITDVNGVHTMTVRDGIAGESAEYEDRISALENKTYAPTDSMNMFGRSDMSVSAYRNAVIEEVENGYSVTYNSSLTSGACYVRFYFCTEPSKYVGKKLKVSYDIAFGSGYPANAAARIAVYEGTASRGVSTVAGEDGHYEFVTSEIVGNADFIALYVYPDSKNNYGNASNITVTNIHIDLDSAVDYVARDAVESKLDKPVDAPTVGKILRVKSVNADGSFVCEWAEEQALPDVPVKEVKVAGTALVPDVNGAVNVPIAQNGTYGIMRVSNYDGSTGINYDDYIKINPATESIIDARTGNMAIAPPKLNYAVKAALTDSNAIQLDDAAKAKACATLGAYRKPTDGWVLKGTITTATKADGATLDLTGCTEVCILCASISMSTTINVRANGVALFYKSSSGSAKKFVVNLRDTICGYSVDGKYSTDLNANPCNTADGYDRIDGSHVASITSITFANPAGIDACDVKIYAR